MNGNIMGFSGRHLLSLWFRGFWVFLLHFSRKKKRKGKKLSLVERLIFHLDTYLIDNPIYFIGSPTCISHTLQVGSCLAQGEGPDEHREEHLQETEGSIAVDSNYSLTSARLLNVQVFLVQPSQENKIQKWKMHFTVAPVHSPFSQGEW